MFPRSEAATQVYVADSRMLSSIRTFLPIGMLSSGVSSNAPSLHLTNGIGDPIATQVMLTDPPGITSTFSGGIEKCGGTCRTVHTKHRLPDILYPNRFVPRCMECRRGLAMRKLSICLSVCPSVRPSNPCNVMKRKKEESPDFLYKRSFILVF